MANTNRRRNGGVHSLKDLKGRCVLDRELGCWVWGGAMVRSARGRGRPNTRVWLAEPPGRAEPATMTATKAAWLLAGHELKPNEVVWRALPQCRHGCINPTHGAAGTRTQMFEAFVSTGQLRGDHHRAVVNAINRRSQLLPREVVAQGEELFAGGKLQKEVAAALGIGLDTARKIRLGAHPNSRGALKVLRGASVFALGDIGRAA